MIAAVNTTKNFLSLVKFSHTIFALPFAIIGFSLGTLYSDEGFSIRLFVLMLLCMLFARSAAMGFNRYIDRRFDAQNARTAIREIPAGIVSPQAALAFVIACSVAFVVTTLFINELCFYLSPIALAVVLGYSYTKRFTWLCHVILGIGLALAPIGAFLAVAGKFDLLPLLFSFTVLFWVSGFDIIYALQDEEFDRSNNLYSIPAYLGKKNALLVSRLLHVCSMLFVLFAGYIGDLGILYWIGTAFFISMLVYQHRLVKPTDLSKVNLAFATTNGVASVVFGCFVVGDIFLHLN